MSAAVFERTEADELVGVPGPPELSVGGVLADDVPESPRLRPSSRGLGAALSLGVGTGLFLTL